MRPVLSGVRIGKSPLPSPDYLNRQNWKKKRKKFEKKSIISKYCSINVAGAVSIRLVHKKINTKQVKINNLLGKSWLIATVVATSGK